MASKYDLIVIGGGPGGYVSAIRGAQEGFKVALVDARGLGGTCLNRGCIPTKSILHMANLYRAMLNADEMGIIANDVGYDMAKIHAQKDEVVGKLRDGVAGLLKANGVDVFVGKGSIPAPGKVKVTSNEGEQVLEGARILLAVGAVPMIPPIPGIDLPGVITSDALLEGTPREIKHLLIIGGGVIGVEVASIYASLGVRVTVIEAADRLLPLLDVEIGRSIAMLLEKRGATVHTGTVVKEITQAGDLLAVEGYSQKTGDGIIEVDTVLLAIGRLPYLEGIMREGMELKTNRGILVDEQFRTNIPGVYAIGDCVSGTPQLAHVAHAQAVSAVCMMAGKQSGIDLSLIPSCIYTEPEIASVGLSADAAKKKGYSVKTSKYVMSSHSKSMLEGLDRGFVKLVFDEQTEMLLGAQLMCGRATDLIGELTAAIVTGATASQLAHLIHPHPSFSEGIGEAVENFFGRAIHIAPQKSARSRRGEDMPRH
ncbi:MAG: dihydrolipoyl dehydrogenase [Oscillospiraceae bacterium]|nr:dihydrolipoyl dehydrogenase [Oscillospiraceae bacterium]